MKNPYPYGAIENTIYWAFHETDNSLTWLVKYVAKKHGITQKSARLALENLTTDDERIERGNRIADKYNLKTPRRKTSKEIHYKLDKEYKDIMK